MKHVLMMTILLAAGAAGAQTATRGRLGTEGVSMIPQGWVPYLGIGAGYTSSDTRSNPTEGMPSQVKVLGSYYSENRRGVYDLGYGLSNQQFSRVDAVERATTGANAEASARYQWDSRWQAGVTASALFNQGRAYGADQGDARFAGLQALKEFDLGTGYIGRLGGRVLTDLNIPGQTSNMALVDFQMGWNPAARRQSVSQAALRERERQRDRDARARRGEEASVTRSPAGIQVVTAEYQNRPGFVYFESNRAGIRSGDRQRLSRLAKALENRSDLFDQVEVIGFADATGQDEYNQNLSEKRAAQVRDYLVSAGWPTDRVQAHGQGATRGLASTDRIRADQDSRRVEIHFRGVRDQAELKRILSEIE